MNSQTSAPHRCPPRSQSFCIGDGSASLMDSAQQLATIDQGFKIVASFP